MNKPWQKQRSGGQSGRAAPDRADAGTGRGGILSLRVFLLERLAGYAIAPVIGILAGSLLMFGGMFLAVAWICGPQNLVDAQHYKPFTALVTGRIVESWVALEFDPAVLPKDKLYWQPYAKIQPCAVVEYAGDWGDARRAFCGNRFNFREDFRFDDWHTLAPGVPFAFPRDGAGFWIADLRMSKAAYDWLSAHPPYDTFMLGKPPPKTALGAMQEQFDQPLDMAVASWSTRDSEIPLAYDPRHPDQPLPARIVDDRRSGFWLGSLIFTLVFAPIGLYVWRFGIALLTGQSGAVLWLFTLAPLLALPWWSDFLPQFLRHANKEWAEIASDMLDDMNRVTRFTSSAPDAALLHDGERMQWHVDAGAYAETFGRVHFSMPQPSPATPELALAALRTQATAQVNALDTVQRADLFRLLREQYEANRQNVQKTFTTAAEDTLRDSNADVAAHKAARNFLIFASGGNYYDDQLDKIEVQPRLP